MLGYLSIGTVMFAEWEVIVVILVVMMVVCLNCNCIVRLWNSCGGILYLTHILALALNIEEFPHCQFKKNPYEGLELSWLSLLRRHFSTQGEIYTRIVFRSTLIFLKLVLHPTSYIFCVYMILYIKCIFQKKTCYHQPWCLTFNYELQIGLGDYVPGSGERDGESHHAKLYINYSYLLCECNLFYKTEQNMHWMG